MAEPRLVLQGPIPFVIVDDMNSSDHLSYVNDSRYQVLYCDSNTGVSKPWSAIMTDPASNASTISSSVSTMPPNSTSSFTNSIASGILNASQQNLSTDSECSVSSQSSTSDSTTTAIGVTFSTSPSSSSTSSLSSTTSK